MLGAPETMRVDKIGALQEFLIAEDVVRRTFRGQTAGVKNVATIRDIGKIVEIVRGDDYRFRPAAPLNQ